MSCCNPCCNPCCKPKIVDIGKQRGFPIDAPEQQIPPGEPPDDCIEYIISHDGEVIGVINHCE